MAQRLAYALLFCIILPLLLAAWAHALEPAIRLPALQSLSGGLALASAGLTLMLWAMATLWFEARGLPMNAFPPSRRAEGGPFALLDHPIYAGFVACTLGASIAAGSAPGLWIITPITVAGCAALVWGFEKDDLNRRLGPRTRPPVLSLAPDTHEPIRPRDLVPLYLLIFPAWLVCYEAIGHIHASDMASTYLAFERAWPVREWTVVIYDLAYPLALLSPLAIPARAGLRRFEREALVAMALAFFFYLALPLIAAPKPMNDSATLAFLLRLERADGLDGRCALPSFHVYWSLAGASALAARSRAAGALGLILSCAIGVACITTGMHSLADVGTGVLLFLLARHAPRLWHTSLRLAERCANTWREWRLGPVRLLIHAVYAFLAAGAGAMLTLALVGDREILHLSLVAGAGLLGAGVWGQALEGGGRLARPFGYFGCMLGAGSTLLALAIASVDVWPLAAAIATSAPLVQAIGRLRCLVQGCCHGRACTTARGITYTDPRARAVALANLRDVPVHATPLYSIIGNLTLLGLLLRLWSVGAAPAFIVGAHLVLTGLLRFVEEHFRGEPQTRIVGGLPVYQWLSIGLVLLGAPLTCIPGTPLQRSWAFTPGAAFASLGIALAFALAMGVDFPRSNARFARLGPASE